MAPNNAPRAAPTCAVKSTAPAVETVNVAAVVPVITDGPVAIGKVWVEKPGAVV
jgi:hypothetical protein